MYFSSAPGTSEGSAEFTGSDQGLLSAADSLSNVSRKPLSSDHRHRLSYQEGLEGHAPAVWVTPSVHMQVGVQEEDTEQIQEDEKQEFILRETNVMWFLCFSARDMRK